MRFGPKIILTALAGVTAVAAVLLMNTPDAQRAAAAGPLAPLPAGWPSTTLQLGTASAPGGAAAMRQVAPFSFRYQYLAGGANTGGGWATWNANGDFARYYIEDSRANNMTPVFTYYMIRQSAPGNGAGEADGVAQNFGNTATMTAYFNDMKLFFQKAGAFTSPVVFHVEPDMWGYGQRRATNDNAATVPVQVSATGLPELAGLPNTMAGLAQAVVKLRNQYATNVKLGYHLSYWGTGNDPIYTKPDDATIDALATRSANFYTSLGANFDVSFAEFSDRDAAFYQYVYNNPNVWWAAADFARNVRYLGKFHDLTQKRIVMWQIPMGNTRMLAMNNTTGHYQDNRPEWLLDEPARTHLTEYINAGVVAFLFGGGAAGTTCACDAQGDGVTNPAAINGNTGTSLNADDDGGFFNAKAKAYYTTGAMPLGGGTAPTPTPASTSTPVAPNTPTQPPAATATPTQTAPPTATPSTAGWTTSVSASPASVSRGSAVRLQARVLSTTSRSALVDVEVYNPAGTRVFQRFYDNQAFSAGVARTFSPAWTVPKNAATGTYTVKIGVFAPAWGTLFTWNNSATTFTVR
jgi:hypothetical protein